MGKMWEGNQGSTGTREQVASSSPGLTWERPVRSHRSGRMHRDTEDGVTSCHLTPRHQGAFWRWLGKTVSESPAHWAYLSHLDSGLFAAGLKGLESSPALLRPLAFLPSFAQPGPAQPDGGKCFCSGKGFPGLDCCLRALAQPLLPTTAPSKGLLSWGVRSQPGLVPRAVRRLPASCPACCGLGRARPPRGLLTRGTISPLYGKNICFSCWGKRGFGVALPRRVGTGKRWPGPSTLISSRVLCVRWQNPLASVPGCKGRRPRGCGLGPRF